jgi:hypothetical protein
MRTYRKVISLRIVRSRTPLILLGASRDEPLRRILVQFYANPGVRTSARRPDHITSQETPCFQRRYLSPKWAQLRRYRRHHMSLKHDNDAK